MRMPFVEPRLADGSRGHAVLGTLASPGTCISLRVPAHRSFSLEVQLSQLTLAAAPRLLARPGIGIDTAAQLLITAGDNPDRLRSEAAFARLVGVAPIPASSGRTDRHRLSRGGDRQANRALHTIALVRLHRDPRTWAYLNKRTAQGLSKKDILRCLKRAIAREVYHDLRPT
jgi:transposase